MAKLKHKLIKNFLNENELKVYQKYCYNRLDENINYNIDQENFSPAWYIDPLMNALLDTKISLMYMPIVFMLMFGLIALSHLVNTHDSA